MVYTWDMPKGLRKEVSSLMYRGFHWTSIKWSLSLHMVKHLIVSPLRQRKARVPGHLSDSLSNYLEQPPVLEHTLSVTSFRILWWIVSLSPLLCLGAVCQSTTSRRWRRFFGMRSQAATKPVSGGGMRTWKKRVLFECIECVLFYICMCRVT